MGKISIFIPIGLIGGHFMKQLNKTPFKDLANMLVVVADRFFIAKKICDIADGDYLAECDYDNQEECRRYLSKVSSAFSSLEENEKNLINNEFFFQGYHNWWTSIYSKATFYRYKKNAMIKFLGAFYHD